MRLPYHLVFGAYGFWLPNDPRGSWSHFVGSWELLQYGSATTVESRRSHAQLEHDQVMRQSAKKALKYPPVVFNGIQARAIAHGFGSYVNKKELHVMACAILPQHVHLILEQEPSVIQNTVIQLKIAAGRELIAEGVHPFKGFRTSKGRYPKCFARGSWLQCLATDEVLPAIEYVQDNPVKEGKRKQTWSFVKADG